MGSCCLGKLPRLCITEICWSWCTVTEIYCSWCTVTGECMTEVTTVTMDNCTSFKFKHSNNQVIIGFLCCNTLCCYIMLLCTAQAHTCSNSVTAYTSNNITWTDGIKGTPGGGTWHRQDQRGGTQCCRCVTSTDPLPLANGLLHSSLPSQIFSHMKKTYL